MCGQLDLDAREKCGEVAVHVRVGAAREEDAGQHRDRGQSGQQRRTQLLDESATASRTGPVG